METLEVNLEFIQALMKKLILMFVICQNINFNKNAPVNKTALTYGICIIIPFV